MGKSNIGRKIPASILILLLTFTSDALPASELTSQDQSSLIPFSGQSQPNAAAVQSQNDLSNLIAKNPTLPATTVTGNSLKPKQTLILTAGGGYRLLEYDAAGHIVRERIYDAQENLTQDTTRIYYSNGTIQSSDISQYQNNILTSAKHWDYNASGHDMQYSLKQYSGGVLVSLDVFTYDGNGHTTSRDSRVYKSDGSIVRNVVTYGASTETRHWEMDATGAQTVYSLSFTYAGSNVIQSLDYFTYANGQTQSRDNRNFDPTGALARQTIQIYKNGAVYSTDSRQYQNGVLTWRNYTSSQSASIFETNAVNATLDFVSGDGVFAYAANLPTGAVFDPKTRLLRWTPGLGQAGTYTITFSAGNASFSFKQTVIINVQTKLPPAFDPIPPQMETAANHEVSLTLTSPDSTKAGDALVFGARELPAGAVFDPTTHTFSWTPQADQVGQYQLTFSLSRGQQTVWQSTTLSVTPDSFVFDADSLSTGQALAADSAAPGWKNAADTVKIFSVAGKAVKYLMAADPTQFNLEMSGLSGDQEITAWNSAGTFLIRYDSALDRGLYMTVSPTVDGTLEMGIYQAGKKYAFYRNSDLVHTLPGYKLTTTSDFFTFGAEGFDLYVKYDGTEIARLTDPRFATTVGGNQKTSAGIKGVAGGKVTIHDQGLPSLYSDLSDPNHPIYDIRDFGADDTTALGDVTAGSRTITLDAATDFKVGENVLVSSNTASSSVTGIGGTWPPIQFANETQMHQSTGVAPGSYVFAADTGKVYRLNEDGVTWEDVVYVPAIQVATTNDLKTSGAPGGTYAYVTGENALYHNGGSWSVIATNVKSYTDHTALTRDTASPDYTYAWEASTSSAYYKLNGQWILVNQGAQSYHQAIPLALETRITAISADGKTLTLADASSLSVNNATITVDSAPAINRLVMSTNGRVVDPKIDPYPAYFVNGVNLSQVTPANYTVSIPAGRFALGESIVVNNHPGITIEGQGADKTFLSSPPGAPTADILVVASPLAVVKDFSLTGNAGSSDFVPLLTGNDANLGRRQMNSGQGGVHFSTSPDSIASGLIISDSPTSLKASYSDRIRFTNVTIHLPPPTLYYAEFAVGFSNTTDGSIDHFSIDSPGLAGGLALGLQSIGTQVSDGTLVNVTMSANSVRDFLVKNVTMTLTKNAQAMSRAYSADGALFDVNGTIAGQKNLAPADYGGTIENLVMNEEDYINPQKNILKGISITHNHAVTIIGGSYTAPNYAADAVGINVDPIAILSAADETDISGFKAFGATGKSNEANIIIRSGTATIKNVTAQKILVNPTTIVDGCLDPSNPTRACQEKIV